MEAPEEIAAVSAVATTSSDKSSINTASKLSKKDDSDKSSGLLETKKVPSELSGIVIVAKNQLKSETKRDLQMSNTTNNDASTSTSAAAAAAAAATNAKKKQHPKKDRPAKTQMKQSSLEANDITLGRQDSWRKRICERTRRSRSTEEDYADNTNDLPSNADLIEERLYLGSKDAACDIRWLKQRSITHILTIDSCPLPNKITDLPFVTTKYLQVTDMPQEDILHYLEGTNKFIHNAICNEQFSGSILIHCYYGVSRSATIVLAYLMHKYSISLEEALERLKAKREVVGPNHGFLSQLKLFEKMGYKIDKNCPAYKRFRLHMAAAKMKTVKVIPPPYTDVVRPDPGVFSVRPEPVVYRCKKCRRILAAGSNLLVHKEGKTPRWTESLHDKEESTVSLCTQMYFVEPIIWMREAGHCLQGKLHCPNTLCKSKLGSFSWVMGCLCPCGAKVQPAFYLVPSKIDRSNSVLNLQITI